MFQPPLEVDPWANVFHATSEGSECPQIDQMSSKFNGSEDCLFLTVHTPEVSVDLLVKR